MKHSAGLLVYKMVGDECHVLLVHPGGPLYGHKDEWSVPKGELDDGEDHLTAAYREFREEVGVEPPESTPLDLGSFKQKSSKVNYVWALEGDVDLKNFSCNTFTMEWPPRSGHYQEFPENDKAAWFTATEACSKLFESQTVFIDRLLDQLAGQIPQPKSV